MAPLRGSRSSPTCTATCPPFAPCSATSSASSPTPSGTWATWWATAPSPMGALSWPRRSATSCSRATTTSACSAGSTSPTSPPRRRGRPLDAREHLQRERGVPLQPRAAARGRGHRALPRQPARSGVGLRDLSLGGGPLHGRMEERVARHRAHPRGFALHAHRRRGSRRGGAGRRASRPLRRMSGWSTRAAWASRATATRAPPGCCSTWATGRPSGGAWSTPWTRPRTRSRRPGCRAAWAIGYT